MTVGDIAREFSNRPRSSVMQILQPQIDTSYQSTSYYGAPSVRRKTKLPRKKGTSKGKK